MMMIEWDSELYGRRQRQWHIGEEIPDHEGYIITFHADGDELHCLISAMEASIGLNPKVVYTKMQGLIPAVDEVE
jgi:hypothetical protein